MRLMLLLAGLLICFSHALAEPQVRVDARLQPPAPYQVGTTLRLEVDLLTSTWFTQAPQPAPLELPDALITPPNGQADKLTLTIEGQTWFGLRLTYLISPTAPGQFTIPALPFNLYLGQAAGPVKVSSAALSFNVTGAALTEQQNDGLVASQLRMTQQWQQSADPLKVGERITRQVRIEATGAQAMLIPPLEFTDIPGLKRYPQAPSVSTLSDGRGSIDGGVRIDSVSYVVEQAGTYNLPAIELQWWSSDRQSAQTSQVPGIEFDALRRSGYQLPFSLEADLEKLGRGRLIRISPLLLMIGGALLLGLSAYLARHHLRAQWTHLQRWNGRRQARWLASERFAWRALQRALRGDAVPLDALYRWQLRNQGYADLQALSGQLPTSAAACLQQALANHYSLQRARQSDLKILRQSLQQLRKQRIRRAGKVDPLHPLRPWPSASANTVKHDTHT